MNWSNILLKLKKISLKKHNEESDEGYFLEVAVQYLEKLHELYTDLSFLPGRLKIEKIEKLVAKLYDKAEYIILVLKQTLNHGLDLKKVIKLIKFNQSAWLKPSVKIILI